MAILDQDLFPVLLVGVVVVQPPDADTFDHLAVAGGDVADIQRASDRPAGLEATDAVPGQRRGMARWALPDSPAA
jgi:hypothetical protein